MEKCTVSLAGIRDRASLFARLGQALPLPDWCGDNLDALYDALTGEPMPARIVFTDWQEAGAALPGFFGRFRRVLEEAADQTPGLEIFFIDPEDGMEAADAPGSAGHSKAAGTGGGGGRTLVITDIHGCYDEMAALLDRMGFNESSDRLINLGDTIDRGPQIYEVFDFLRGLKDRMGERCVLIRGNHEQMMLDALARGGYARELWYYNKGEKTVFAFLHHKHHVREFADWYEAMPFYYQTEAFTCVHASLDNPDPAQNATETLIWGRDTDYEGRLALTGHTPYRAPVYFMGKQYHRLEEDQWLPLPANGMIALDTGCVYGNRLTGMVVRGDGQYLVTSVPSSVGKKK